MLGTKDFKGSKIFRNLSPFLASTFLLIDTVLRQTRPAWQPLADSAGVPPAQQKWQKKSPSVPTVPEKATDRALFDWAWITCPPLTQSLCPERCKSWNGQTRVIYPPLEIGSTYLKYTVRCGGYFKENHRELFLEQGRVEFRSKQPLPAVVVMVWRPISSRSPSLCASGWAAISLWGGVQRGECNLQCGITCEKWVTGMPHP